QHAGCEGPNQAAAARRVFGSQESLTLINAGAFVKKSRRSSGCFFASACPLKDHDTGLSGLNERLERQALSKRPVARQVRNRGGTKVPGTPKAASVAVKRHRGDQVSAGCACALPDSVLLLPLGPKAAEGLPGLPADPRPTRLPQPLLTPGAHQAGRALPVACLGDGVKTNIGTGGGAKQLGRLVSVEDEGCNSCSRLKRLELSAWHSWTMSAVLLCHRGCATVHDLGHWRPIHRLKAANTGRAFVPS
uniref:Kinesin motor domain-containing protein n=1 Tax=Macrostomum lignano TaxID=282301 RepID=A0A1I8FRE6_9PLAT